MKTITITCPCGTDIEYSEIEGWPGMATSRTCSGCEAAEIQRSRDHHAAFLAGQVDNLTPPRLLTPDTSHPAFNLDLWRKVKEWQPTREKPWLGIIGTTGECKTRCAFLRLRQFAMAGAQAWDGRRNAPDLDAVTITGMDFNRLAVERFSKEAKKEFSLIGTSESIAGTASRTLRTARTADLLIFDELGKVKASPGTVDEIFSLIDYRSARNLVTLWTSNATPEKFCAAWPEEYAEPGCGRIIEASTIIKA